MMKKNLLKLLLVGGLVISSAIGLSSCKKNNEANEDLNSLPVVETIAAGDRDFGLYCPYCGEIITVNTTDHWHLFGYKPGHPYEFAVTDCERAYSLPSGYHYCPYAAEGRVHAHQIVYELDGGVGPNGHIDNSWHVGGGTPYWP